MKNENVVYGGCSQDVQGMSGMQVCEALEIAEQCANSAYPPTNPNLLIRAIYTLQCHRNFDGPKNELETLRAGVNVIAAWKLSCEGFDITAHGEAMDKWNTAKKLTV